MKSLYPNEKVYTVMKKVYTQIYQMENVFSLVWQSCSNIMKSLYPNENNVYSIMKNLYHNRKSLYPNEKSVHSNMENCLHYNQKSTCSNGKAYIIIDKVYTQMKNVCTQIWKV